MILSRDEEDFVGADERCFRRVFTVEVLLQILESIKLTG